MTNGERLFLTVLLVNGLLAVGYCVWQIAIRKDGANKKKYVMQAVMMVLCPVVGMLYFLFGWLKYRFVQLGQRDLSAVAFSKTRRVSRVKADENRERNIVSVRESILISDQEQKRNNMLNILLGETEESLAAIALALNSDDSEIAHYAASFLQSQMDHFRETVRKKQQEIAAGDLREEHCQKQVVELIRYMDHILKQNVFTAIEQTDYVEQMVQLGEQLFQHAKQVILPDCYASIMGRLMELEEHEQADLWGERFYQQYPGQLTAYTLRLKLYFETRQKERFFVVMQQLRASSVVVDSQTLEMIRMVQS